MTTTARAYPMASTVVMMAVCDNCGQQIAKNVGNPEYPWYHSRNGSEFCTPGPRKE